MRTLTPLLAVSLWLVGGCGGGDSTPAPDGAVPGDAGAPPVDPLVVAVEQGDVRGVADGDLRIFRGIPYAAPPVGPLRFQPPQAPPPFDAEHDASGFGPMCPQLERGEGIAPRPPPTAPVVGDEDCLTLNVWTHADDAGPRPVMVFIHGGGFQSGATSGALYDGAGLARAGDVIVVSIEYRLGVLGLLATEQLATESGVDSAGNYAIQDQIAALDWLRRNLAAFGGDPDQVTIFGESAGGLSVCVLLGSPPAQGLFLRAIAQSGGGCYGLPSLRSAPPGRQSAMERGAEILTDAGCAGAPDELACMRDLSVEALVRAGTMGTTSGLGLPSFSPNIDGVVVTDDARDRFLAGEVDHPLMIGSNADEAVLFTLATVIRTEAEYERRVRLTVGPAADALLALYPASSFASPKAAYDAAFGELSFVCPAVAMAAAAATGPEPSFAYHFTHAMTGGVLAELGAFHGLELMYLFGNWANDYAPSADDLAVRDLLQRAWTTFARGGAPQAEPAFRPYGEGAPAFMVLDEPAASVDEIVEGRCAELARIGLVPAH